MRRWLPVVALGLAVAMLAIVAVLILVRRAGTPGRAVRGHRQRASLPGLPGPPVADSPSAAAREIGARWTS